MALDRDQSTEQATESRRREAREAGRIVQSRDLVAAASLLSGLLLLHYRGGDFFGKFAEGLKGRYQNLFSGEAFTTERVLGEVANEMNFGLAVFLPFGVILWASAVLFGVTQTGGLFRSTAVSPEIGRISFRSGASRLLSLRGFGRGTFAAAKVLVVSVALFFGAQELLTDGFLREISSGDLARGVAISCERILGIFLYAAWGLFSLAVLDWFLQWWLLERDLRMTRQEVIEEQRKQQQRPEIRRQRERMRRSWFSSDAILEIDQLDDGLGGER